MQTDWIRGLDENEAIAVERALGVSRILIDRLHAVVTRKIEETERVATNDYDSPSWAYKAADREGYIRALKYILLLTKENKLKKD